MSINLVDLYARQYSTNVNLLLQTVGGKFRRAVTEGTYQGDQASPVDQIGAVEMQEVTTRFGEMPRVDAPTARRWVFPTPYDLPQLVDQFDKMKIVSDPQSSYVQNGVKAAMRQFDRVIINAFLGTSKTGVAGATSTTFTSGNEVDVAVGGANSKLNVQKIKAVKELMEANDVDFEMEEVYIAITAADHAALLDDIQIISSEFKNGEAPVLQNGRVTEFLGFRFIRSELVETLLAGTNEVTLPVWCKSGMHLGLWQDLKADITQRKDLRGQPWQIYQYMMCGATRLEEDKVYAIESYRA